MPRITARCTLHTFFQSGSLMIFDVKNFLFPQEYCAKSNRSNITDWQICWFSILASWMAQAPQVQKKISGSCFMPVFNLHPIAMHCSAQHTALHHLTYCTCAQYTLRSPEFQCKLRSLDKTVKMSAVQFSSEASDSFCCSCTGASPLLLRCLFHTFLLHKYLMLASEKVKVLKTVRNIFLLCRDQKSFQILSN